MPPAKSKPTDFEGAWTELLSQSLALPDRPEGDGWRTAKELADDPTANPHGKNHKLVQKAMDHLVDTGRVEKAKGRQNGRTTNYYRPCLNR